MAKVQSEGPSLSSLNCLSRLNFSFIEPGSQSGMCGLALRKADVDDTVQWLPRLSVTQNDPAPAAFLTPSALASKSPNWPSAGRTTSAGAAGEIC